MQIQIKNIKEKLAKLKALDNDLKILSDDKRDFYFLSKCLTERQIVNIEKKYNIILPTAYRLFLKQIGNGYDHGYGLYSLKRGIEELHGDNHLGLIDKPFPLKKMWLGTTKMLSKLLSERDKYKDHIHNLINDYGKKYVQYFYDLVDEIAYFNDYTAFGTNHLIPYKGKIDKKYLDEAYEKTVALQVDKGVLTILHAGSGAHYRLVVAGKQKGTVWLQGVEGDCHRKYDNFLNFYEDFLDKELLDSYFSIGNHYKQFIPFANQLLKKSKNYGFGKYATLQLYERLGKAYTHVKEFQLAINQFQHILDQTAKKYIYFRHRASNWLSYSYLRLKQYKQVVARLENMRDKDAWSFNLLGAAYGELKLFDNAILAYKKAIKLNPDSPISLDNMGYVYTRMGQYTKALKIHQQVIKKHPTYAWAYYNIAVIYALQNQITQSIPYFVQSVALGYSIEEIKKDTYIKNLKSTEEYKKLIIK